MDGDHIDPSLPILFLLMSLGVGVWAGRVVANRPRFFSVLAILGLPSFLAWRLHRIGLTQLGLAHLVPILALVFAGFFRGLAVRRRVRRSSSLPDPKLRRKKHRDSESEIDV